MTSEIDISFQKTWKCTAIAIFIKMQIYLEVKYTGTAKYNQNFFYTQ